ncbi:MAG TPA: tetratricopeptide repeat protein [Verrucomicrobiae bacterium]|jgi:tetratricopeptide (TPR) repeat protein|nr:tetratricopeptide repeat protein [Verrucomicrobiae bacterium]
MKRLFAIVVLLFVLLPCVHADGPDDQYIQIYNLIQEGDSLGASQAPQAVAKYTEAQKALLKFQKIYPGWNDRVVHFRLNYLASKITILSANIPGASSVPPPIASAPPRPQTVTTSPQTPKAPVIPPVPQTASAPAPHTSEAEPSAPPPLSPVTPALLGSSDVRTSAPPMIVLPQPGPSTAELQNQIADLQNQLRQLQGEKSLTEAKLREALAARPAGADPREFAQAQEKLRSIQKENELLQVSLAQEREKAAALANSAQLQQTKQELTDTKRQLSEQTTRVTQLAQENESLRGQIKTLTASNADLAGLRTENAALKKTIQEKSSQAPPPPEVTRQLAQAQATIASLQADKEVWNLEKEALQNRVKQLSARPPAAAASNQDGDQVKQLEHERDDLQKKLDAAQKELYARKETGSAAHVDELATELETMRAKLDVYELKPVPYTAEELALFKKPNVAVAASHAAEKPARELPAGTAELAAGAQRDFSAGNYAQAEKKYLEVLRRDPKNVNTLANLATVQLEMGHLEDAEKNLQAAVAITPDDAFTLSILGNLKFRQGKYDEALDALSRAAKAEPRNAEIQNFLGLTLSQKGMRNAAEAAFRKAILLNPNYAGAQNNLAVFYLTQQPPSVELARWHYDKAVAAGFPRNPELEKMLDDKKTAQPGQ